jgi:L-seryl-tRNA(Ser) seleniumtransferase
LATVECYDRPSLGTDSLPIWMCLATSVENLKNRAERLAAQLAHVESVASSVAVETHSPLSAEPAAEGRPSYGVALTAKNGDIASLDSQLRRARFPIVGRIEGELLILDLRTVIPRQDKQIVDSLLGQPQTGITP